jgi:hypothetical protein
LKLLQENRKLLEDIGISNNFLSRKDSDSSENNNKDLQNILNQLEKHQWEVEGNWRGWRANMAKVLYTCMKIEQ